MFPFVVVRFAVSVCAVFLTSLALAEDCYQDEHGVTTCIGEKIMRWIQAEPAFRKASDFGRAIDNPWSELRATYPKAWSSDTGYKAGACLVRGPRLDPGAKGEVRGDVDFYAVSYSLPANERLFTIDIVGKNSQGKVISLASDAINVGELDFVPEKRGPYWTAPAHWGTTKPRSLFLKGNLPAGVTDLELRVCNLHPSFGDGRDLEYMRVWKTELTIFEK